MQFAPSMVTEVDAVTKALVTVPWIYVYATRGTQAVDAKRVSAILFTVEWAL